MLSSSAKEITDSKLINSHVSRKGDNMIQRLLIRVFLLSRKGDNVINSRVSTLP
jgi:hypothetical protein